MELPSAEDARTLALGLLEAAPDAILVIRPGGAIALANRMAERLFGYDRTELVGMSVEELIPSEHRHQHVVLRTQYENQGRTRVMGELAALSALRKNGDLRPVEVSLSPVGSSIGKLTIAIVRDVTRRRAFEAELRHAGTHDALTGLFNRAYLESVRPGLEASNDAVGVVIIDVDDLKGVNDTLGHEAGDQIIKRAAVVLRATAGPDDVAARLGGDEFAMLVPHADVAVLAAKVALLRDELERHNEVHRGARLELSVGSALTEARGGITLAMRVADRRMYDEKHERAMARAARGSKRPRR